MSPAPEQTLSKQDRSGAWRRVWRVLSLRAPLLAKVLASNLRLGSALDSDWRDRYERSRKDLWANDPSWRPSRQWTIITWFYRLVLRGKGLEGFKSTFGRFLTTYEPNNPWIFQAAHHLYFQELKRRDDWGLLEKLEEPELGNGDFILYRGKRLSLDLLQSIDELYRLRETLGFAQDDAVVFCELGAGYGRLADVVLSAMPKARYWIFDLPESLLLSQYYLTKRHPNASAALYPASGDLLGKRLVFGLPHELKAAPAGVIDVFVNVFSFMEMGREQIEAYFGVIEKLEVGALFLKQHKVEANLFDKAMNRDNNYPVRPDWKRLYYGTTALFEHAFEAVYRVKTRRPAPARDPIGA